MASVYPKAVRKPLPSLYGASRDYISVGKYPTVSLAEARKEAKRILAQRTLQKHRPTSIGFSEALRQFLTDVEAQVRPRTHSEYKRLLERHWKPRMRHLKVEDITAHDIHKRLNRLHNTPQEQAHALTALKRFLKWAHARNYSDYNPALAITLKKSKARDRVLSDDEIKAVWNAATSYPFGYIIRMLMLTGMRRMEVGKLEKQDIEPDAIVIPSERAKNHRSHYVPRTPTIDAFLEEVPNADDTLVFTATGKVYMGWSRAKRQLDKDSGVYGWTIHDIRRTVATQLAAMSTPPHIVEKLLNHKSGTISGVAAVYNRFDYFDECKAALELWHERLLQLVAR